MPDVFDSLINVPGDDPGRAVSGAVVDDDLLPFKISLGQNAIDALCYEFLMIVSRGDDRDEGPGIHPVSIVFCYDI